MPDLTDALRPHRWNKMLTGFAGGQRDLSDRGPITLEGLGEERLLHGITPMQPTENTSHIRQQNNRRQDMQAFVCQSHHTGNEHSSCLSELRMVWCATDLNGA
jgi:hypothetical protein